jgi:hypothetical protein
MPMPRLKEMPPAFAIGVCVARTLHELDPKFLAALKSNVEAFREPQSGWTSTATADTLDIFYSILSDPEIFSPRPEPSPKVTRPGRKS